MKIAFRSFLMLAFLSETVLLFFVNAAHRTHWWLFFLPVGLIGGALVMLLGGMWWDYRRSGWSWAASLSITSSKFGIPRMLLALLVSEVSSLSSSFGIFRFRMYRKGSAEVYTVHKNLRTVVFMVLGLSAVEIVVVHLALPNRFWRYVFMILSLYAVLLLAGFYASVRDRPHLMTPQVLSIRYGKRFICEIPWAHLKNAKAVGAGHGRDITFDGNGHLRVPVMGEVNIRLEVEPPVPVEDLYKGRLCVSSVDVYCDDRDLFLKGVAEKCRLLS